MYDTRAEIEALAAKTDPDFEKLLDSVRNGSAPSNDPRAMMLAATFIDVAKFLQANPQIPDLPDTPTEFTVRPTMRDGHVGEVRVYKPRTAAQAGAKTPLVVLYHGGGFVLGHCSHLGPFAKVIAHTTGATVCSVGYRLAPAYKFPTAPHDAWDSLAWIASEAGLAALGGDVDPSKGFVIGGVSAGSNLAAVTAQKSALLSASNDAGKLAFPLTGTWLSLPFLYEEPTVPEKYRHLWFSREQNADSAIISAKDMDYVKETYEYEAKSPDLSPGYGQGADAASKLPPTYLQVCGMDPLRDDGLVYDKVLRDAGVETRLEVYPGVPHGFADLTDIPLAVKSRNDTVKGFAWLLKMDKEPTDEECLSAWMAAA